MITFQEILTEGKARLALGALGAGLGGIGAYQLHNYMSQPEDDLQNESPSNYGVLKNQLTDNFDKLKLNTIDSVEKLKGNMKDLAVEGIKNFPRFGQKVVDAGSDAAIDGVKNLASAKYEDMKNEFLDLKGTQPSIGRSLGLGTRDVLTGLGSLPKVVVSPFLNAANAALGGDPKYFSHNVGDIISDKIGLPTAVTGPEKLASSIGQIASPMVRAGIMTNALGAIPYVN